MRPKLLGLLLCCAAPALFLAQAALPQPAFARAQTDDTAPAATAAPPPASGYRVHEDTGPAPDATPAAPPENGDPSAADGPATAADEGPVRMARFSYINGDVTWRATDGDEWSPASVNLPLRQGAQIWVNNGGRAEIQFDDGSLLRLGNGAVATLQTMYSDVDGEFTEIGLQQGLSALRLRHDHSVYQIDTPFVSVRAGGESKVRVGVDDTVEVAVREGSALVSGNAGKTTLNAGGYVNLATADSPYDVRTVPGGDTWDRWNDDRDVEIARADSHLPENIGTVAGDLGTYGDWRIDPTYGSVWCPRVAAGWRPYCYGRWVWCDPFGWTWVSSEPWGWAPYHYGTWVNLSFGWSWVPGPARQYWCPAVVHFSTYNGCVAWAPLAPHEVRYPISFGIGFARHNWSAYFSIGGCAVYYPAGPAYCAPRPWRNGVVNRVTVVNNVNIVNRPSFGHNVYLPHSDFVPVNARNHAGVTTASLASFGGRGSYAALDQRGGADYFTRGRSVGAPPAGARPYAGPSEIRPTAASLTPARTYTPAARPLYRVQNRPVYRGSLPDRVQSVAPPLRPSVSQPGFGAGRSGGFGRSEGGFGGSPAAGPGVSRPFPSSGGGPRSGSGSGFGIPGSGGGPGRVSPMPGGSGRSYSGGGPMGGAPSGGGYRYGERSPMPAPRSGGGTGGGGRSGGGGGGGRSSGGGGGRSGGGGGGRR